MTHQSRRETAESRTTPAQNQENLSINVKTPTKQTDTSLTGLVFTDILCEATSAKTIGTENYLQFPCVL